MQFLSLGIDVRSQLLIGLHHFVCFASVLDGIHRRYQPDWLGVPSSSLVAFPAARALEGLPRLGDKLPIVARGMKRQFQNSKRITLMHFTVGLGVCKRAM